MTGQDPLAILGPIGWPIFSKYLGQASHDRTLLILKPSVLTITPSPAAGGPLTLSESIDRAAPKEKPKNELK
jgi:hypothetical protein